MPSKKQAFNNTPSWPPLSETNIAHHIKGIRPALTVMADLGFSDETCLKGTGMTKTQLEQADQGISLQQELAFYRRLLNLTKDPQLGLKLGKAYRPENYGVFGYAILSAQTLGQALGIAKDFALLSFSHFELDYAIDAQQASIIMRQNKALDAGLLTLYEDRDCSAILHGARTALGQHFPISAIDLMHEAPASIDDYSALFNCPVRFEQANMAIHFHVDVLSLPMPLRDPETSAYCRQQCQQLLKKIAPTQSRSAQIQRLLTSEDYQFPSFAELSNMLDIPERTLRRQLKDEGNTYQDLLNDARFNKAKTLLASDHTLDSIAQALGYSETGNFSHAFKRWSGVSPTQYREKYH